MKAPAFQFYAQDFLTGVMYLTNEEIGIYIKMLAKQWTDGKIPKKRLVFLSGLEWDKFSDELKEKFKDCGEYLINERLEDERNKKISFLEKQRINGKKGGRPLKNENPNNPNDTQKKPLEDEDEDEDEDEIEKDNAYDYLNKKEKGKIEIFEMQNKKSFPDYELFVSNFNNKVILEKLEFDPSILMARLRLLNTNWNKTPSGKNKQKKVLVSNRD